MDNTEARTVQAALSAFLAVLSCYGGVVVVPLVILMVVMVIDYITGMVSAWHSAELSSRKGLFGIVKKVSYLALVLVGMGVDWLIYSGLQAVNVSVGYTVFFGVLVTIWLVINELISILENLDAIGVPLPKFLVTAVKRLKATTEKLVNDKESEEKKT